MGVSNLKQAREAETAIAFFKKKLQSLKPYPKLAASFNDHGLYQAALQAYLRDIPERMGAEHDISHYERLRACLQQNSMAPSPAF